MKEFHPDNNGGDFKNKEEKLLYNQLKEAIKEIGNKPQDSLPAIINYELVAVVKSLREKPYLKVSLFFYACQIDILIS